MAEKTYLRKVIGDDSVYEQAEKEYIIARRTKAFEEYWEDQLHSLPEQITTLFNELVNNHRLLKRLTGKLVEYRNIFDVINLLIYFYEILPSNPDDPIKIWFDDLYLEEFSFDEDLFMEDGGETDIFWDDGAIIAYSDFNRLVNFDASNVFKNKLYLSNRWQQLGREILSIFEGEKEYKKYADKDTNIANALFKIISKKTKKKLIQKLNLEENLFYFINQFTIVFKELLNHELLENYKGENVTIEIKNQTPGANKVEELKSEIFKLNDEIKEMNNKSIPEKIDLHIHFLKNHYLVSASEAEGETGRYYSYEKSNSSLFSLKLEEGIEAARKNQGMGSPVARLPNDVTETDFMHLVKDAYIQFFTSQLYDNDPAPDEALITFIGSVADYFPDEESKSAGQTNPVEINKGELYPIQHTSDTRPIQYHPVGLTHSGGGRRAEIFNLGIQQELAKLGALPWFDYLTTVSGGGWAGVNMVSLLSRKSSKTDEYFFNTQWSKYPFNPGRKIFKIPATGPEPAKAEQKEGWIEEYVADEVGQNAQLKYLRDNGNYLAPRQGWINRDALRVLGWIVSSLMMNIFTFLFAIITISSAHYLLSAALAPDIANTYTIGDSVTCSQGQNDCYATNALAPVILGVKEFGDLWPNYALLAFISAVASLVVIMAIKVSYKKFDKNQKMMTKKIKKLYKRRSAILFSLLTIIIIALSLTTPEPIQNYWIFPLFFVLILLVFWRRNKKWGAPPEDGRSAEEDLDTYLLESSAIFSLSFPIFLIALWKWIMHWTWSRGLVFFKQPASPQIFWILMPLVISLGAGIGLRLYLMRQDKKAIRESRFRSIFWAYLGYHNIYMIVVGIFTAISLTLFFSQLNAAGSRFALPVSTAIISAAWTGIMAYRKDKDKMGSLTASLSSIFKFSTGLRNYLLGFLVILLNLSLIFIFESLIDQNFADPFTVLGIVSGSFIIIWILSRFVNFNNMSLHYFWRDRTEEAFLKTDLVGKHGEVVTVRDDRNLILSSQINELNCSAPYHLITTAVNLQGSWRFDVKDRKSQHFIFSRDYTGSEITGYVKTNEFRTGEIEDEKGKVVYKGLTKYSKAMAISAAAFASALGNQSFFAEGFAMTLFNIRLGWWMLNPKLYDPDIDVKKKFPVAKKIFDNKGIDKNKFLSKLENKSGLASGWAPYIFDEALSLASERRELVNLSDGGHTGDNPGVYPLLQRRCKVIVVGDASFDPTSQCEQFMNALLYAKNDLRIDVDIDLTGLYPATEDNDNQKEAMSKNHCAVGEITYPAFEKFPEEKGWIIYLKTAITPEDPSQLLQYWMGHKDMFPQPSTMDQFFEEDQYEAQRLLGEISVRQPLEKLEKYYQMQIKEIKDTTEKGRAVFKLGLVQQVLKRNPDFTELKKNFNEMMADLQKALMQ